MNKLIYFTLGSNPKYINIAKICIDSLYFQGYRGDILFITDQSDQTIYDVIKFYTKPKFVRTQQNSLALSSANKLKIYLEPTIYDYDKIIFCDLDVIWTNSPENIFNIIQHDMLYMSNELVNCKHPKHLMSSHYFGGDLLTEIEKETINRHHIYGLNAGFFAFNKHIIHHIEQMDLILTKNPLLMNSCLEQPMVNVYSYRNNLYSNALNDHVCHEGYNLHKYQGTALHFAGGPGNYYQKLESMIRYYNENF